MINTYTDRNTTALKMVRRIVPMMIPSHLITRIPVLILTELGEVRSSDSTAYEPRAPHAHSVISSSS